MGDFETQKDRREGSVGAVVVSYNRREILREVLSQALAQTRPVDEVVVLDNNSGDGTADMVAREFPQVTLLALSENLGAAGGYATAIKAAHDRGHAWMWLLGDDDLARPEALERCLEVYQQLCDDAVGMVHPWATTRGTILQGSAMWRGGQKPAVVAPDAGVYDVDVANFDGSLLHRRITEHIGFPRSEYFHMWEEHEYCLRMKAAGFRIVAVPEPLIEHLKPPSGHVEAPWRGYYQTRNQLAHALERRSVRELLWWARRQLKWTVGTVIHYDSKVQRLWLRARGAWHGLRGRMGRTVEPPLPVFRGDHLPDD